MNYIYGYKAFSDENHRHEIWPEYIKVGQTERKPSIRIKEQEGQTLLNNLCIFSNKAEKNSGQSFSDHDFHSFLRSKGIERYMRDDGQKTEWFKLTEQQLLDYYDYFINDKAIISENYSPRIGSQDIFIQKCVKWFRDGGKHFLCAAKVRFGKTPSAYWVAKEMGVNKICIITYRSTDTMDEWKKPCINGSSTHKDFEKFQFIDYRNPEKIMSNVDTKVLFTTFQGSENENLEYIFENEKFDLVIIDEDHYGACKDKARNILDKIKSNHFLHLSGTPYYQLQIEREKFDENNTFSFSYNDEQKLKYDSKSLQIQKQYQDLPDYVWINIESQDFLNLGDMFESNEEGFINPEMAIKGLNVILGINS